MEKKETERRYRIAIVGTGLIGCSMAGGLRDLASGLTGVDNNQAHLQEALSGGWIDRSMSAGMALRDAEIVILAVPADILTGMLPEVLDQVGDDTTVIDVASVKDAVCRSVDGHPRRGLFVAAHPMAGLAVSGPGASDPRLFLNRKVVVCEKEKSSRHALETASVVFDRLGLQIVYMDPRLHDLCVSKVSHLPQVMAYCLSAITTENGDSESIFTGIASSGYESSTRLSSSPADMWIPIFRHNSENLTSSLDEIIALLTGVRQMIGTGNWRELESIIEKANRSREAFMAAYKQ